MQRFIAVVLAFLILVNFYSYEEPLQTVEEFVVAQFIEQSRYNECVDWKRFYECIETYGNQHAPLEYISQEEFKKILTRMARRESRFKQFAFNEKTKARGLFQIIDSHWNLLLWKIDNGNLGKHISNKKITNTEKYYFRIAYNTEMGCIIFSDYIRKSKGNINTALKRFAGFYKIPKNIKSEAERKEFIRRGDEYIKFVMEF